MFDVGHYRFVIDGVGYHSVGKLASQHGPQLVTRQFGVHVAKSKRMETSIPIPDADILNLGGHHSFVGHMTLRSHQVVAHHPPGIVVLVAEAFGHGRYAAEPVAPAVLGGGQRFGKGDGLTVQIEIAADVEVDGQVVAGVQPGPALVTRMDRGGLPATGKRILVRKILNCSASNEWGVSSDTRFRSMASSL